MNQMKQLKENFSTFHPQVFHTFPTCGKSLWMGISIGFPHGLVFPLLVFHKMWIYTSLTSMLFCLDKGVHFRDALAEMESMGEVFGVIAHEIAHNLDELSENAKEVTEKIINDYGIVLLPDDYAKWGEDELFADLMALNFYAILFEKDEIKDVQSRNKLIQNYAMRRKLRKGLYKPFLKDPIIELGSNLKNPIVIRRLAEEYEHIDQQKCSKCGGNFDKNLLERKSYVIYDGKPHDVLRCHCSQCKKTQDYYFDFTHTMFIPEEQRSEAIEQMKQIYGEVTDPIPEDIFTI